MTRWVVADLVLGLGCAVCAVLGARAGGLWGGILGVAWGLAAVAFLRAAARKRKERG